VVCPCGNENGLEAIAGGGALLRDAVAAGLPVSTTRDVVQLAAQGDGPALELVRDAGRTIGTVLAGISDAPDRSGRVGAALMAIGEFLDEDSVRTFAR
jgi:predicted NBD/HSP70 family sugar kinase